MAVVCTAGAGLQATALCTQPLHNNLPRSADKGHTCERSRNPDGSLSGADRSTASDAAFWDAADVYRRMDFSLQAGQPFLFPLLYGRLLRFILSNVLGRTSSILGVGVACGVQGRLPCLPLPAQNVSHARSPRPLATPSSGTGAVSVGNACATHSGSGQPPVVHPPACPPAVRLCPWHLSAAHPPH